MHKRELYYVPGSILVSGVLIALSIYTSTGRIVNKSVTTAPSLQKSTSATIPSNAKIPPVTAADHIKGKTSARVVLVEYSDTECPFCKKFHTTLNQILKTYSPNDVAWVYRHYPLTQLHPKASKEAEATECAAEQGGNTAFWQYTDRLYEITPSNNKLESSELVTVAKTIGLETKAFEACLASNKYAAKVEAERVNGAAAGVRGTPYSFLVTSKGVTPVNGAVPLETLKAQIDTLLSSTSKN